MEKYKIEKGSVMETLLLPLCGKKKAFELFPDIFTDKEAGEIFDKINPEFEEFGKIKMKIGAILAGLRQYDLATVCRNYLKNKPNAAVVNLGCGLDTTYSLVKTPGSKAFNIDFKEVIDIRKELLGEREQEKNIVSDITDISWFDQIDVPKENGAIFFASGVFYYIKKEDIKKMINSMAKRFPEGCLVFDATNAKGLKKMLKTWMEPTEMDQVGIYFSLEDENEIYSWSENIKKVVKKPYMSGYRPLDKRFGFFVNKLFRYFEKQNKSQIIEIYFK